MGLIFSPGDGVPGNAIIPQGSALRPRINLKTPIHKSLQQRRNLKLNQQPICTIMKNTKIPGWEKATLGIGFHFFNFFNHPNFGYPGTGLILGLGIISNLQQPPTSILGGGFGGFGGDVAPRMIQLKAQLQF
jgi:hypothetical protein